MTTAGQNGVSIDIESINGILLPQVYNHLQQDPSYY